MNTVNEVQSINSIFNGTLSDIAISLETATSICKMLTQHFETSSKAIAEDHTKQQTLISSYSDIQTLITVMLDYLHPMKQQLDDAFETYDYISAALLHS